MSGKIKLYIAETAHPTAKNEPWRNIDLDRLRKAAIKYDGEVFSVCNNPKKSDMILFSGDMGPHLEFVRISKLYRKYRNKCFVFSAEGKAIKFVRGLYASIEGKEYSEKLYRGGFYLIDEHIKAKEEVTNPKYLYSFVGSIDTSETRTKLLKLNRKDSPIVDVSGKVSEAWANYEDETEKKKLIDSYISSILNSKFVLCPRGYNCSSIRLFESMKLGRAPVIISDEWTSPIGPDWDSCSVRINERDILKIPVLLKERENEWKDLGESAKETWEKYFSDTGALETITKSCSDIAKYKSPSRCMNNLRCYYNSIRSGRFKYYIRTRINLYKEFKKLYL
ncbi:MAG: hypothetical protein CMI31_06400 [Opitutae bacterium]|nr:hypothetical protein [Opitutae bacterium]|tara:strand:+ start:39 stop:1046 length:1008 start_codon:yes stop_codon:yes gene_type:complete